MAPEYDSGVPNPTPEYAAPEPVPDAAVEPEPDAVPPPTPDYAAPMYGAPIPVEPDGGK
jgi:hypothetical protein